MTTAERIITDKRKIKSAWIDAPDETGATVGYSGVTSIKPYEENGEMAAVTWLAVYKDDALVKRLNTAHMAEITYFPEEKK